VFVRDGVVSHDDLSKVELAAVQRALALISRALEHRMR
jgi:hypothetical protein